MRKANLHEGRSRVFNHIAGMESTGRARESTDFSLVFEPSCIAIKPNTISLLVEFRAYESYGFVDPGSVENLESKQERLLGQNEETCFQDYFSTRKASE